MLKTLAAGSVAIALVASMTSAAFADKAGEREYHQSQVRQCKSLMQQFDGAKTHNAEALALRKRAGNNCEDSAKYSAADGIAELEKALKLINVKPM